MELSNRPGIGNYKGVMLCNRPFAGVSAAAKQSYNRDSTAPFRSTGQIKEQLGLNPIRQPPVILEEKTKKDTALSKHKRFLSEMIKQKKQLEIEMEEEFQAKEERKVKFQEKLKLKRLDVVKERRGYEEKTSSEEKTFERQSENQLEEKTKEEHPVKRKKSSRPKWALTEEAVEELDDIEADELVDFAKDLDFESFLDDLEVQSALKAAKSRIDNLKKNRAESKVDDELSEGWSDVLSDTISTSGSVISGAGLFEGKSRQKNKLGDWNKTTRVQEGKEDDDNASVASARSFLSDISSSSIKSLRHIHSARSLAKIASKVKQASMMQPIEEDTRSISYNEPTVVSIAEDDHARLTQKQAINKLPYMNRNPAI